LNDEKTSSKDLIFRTAEGGEEPGTMIKSFESFVKSQIRNCLKEVPNRAKANVRSD
jgi:hypothetical protein